MVLLMASSLSICRITSSMPHSSSFLAWMASWVDSSSRIPVFSPVGKKEKEGD